MADPLTLKKTLRRRMEESGAEGDEAPKKAAAPAPAASAPRFTREYSAEDREKQKRGLAEALKKRGY